VILPVAVVVATSLLLPCPAGGPDDEPARPIATEHQSPAPLGCTDHGELRDGTCSKGRPVYLPDGEALGYLRLTAHSAPSWPEGTSKEIVASLNLELVVLPDGTVGEIRPTFLRVTLPGEAEQRMNPGEDGFGFVRAASEAVRTWRYAPPTLNGAPVAAYGSVCVDFAGAGAEEEESGDD